MPDFRSLVVLVGLLVTDTLSLAADWSFNETLTAVAFGSCHKQKYADADIWRAVLSTKPQLWLWTGDAVYPPSRSIASVDMLDKELQWLRTSPGYAELIQSMRILGTWDDHDFGGNDMGANMPDIDVRVDVYWRFLGLSRPPSRDGVYMSADFGIGDQIVKVIIMDTRVGRSSHCLPSPATTIPVLGAGLGCLGRWLTAGLRLDRFCDKGHVLSRDQWEWLEQLLADSTASAHILVSSIQVLTNNPAMESWGHFPAERERLLRLLTGVPGLIILSGDVHHAEIAGPLLEVTSSGLTHHCGRGLYGRLCRPLLETFGRYRYRPNAYFIGRNFGTVHFDWDAASLRVDVHSLETGEVMLTTGNTSFAHVLTDDDVDALLPGCIDGHLLPLAQSLVLAPLVLLVFALRRRRQMAK